MNVRYSYPSLLVCVTERGGDRGRERERVKMLLSKWHKTSKVSPWRKTRSWIIISSWYANVRFLFWILRECACLCVRTCVCVRACACLLFPTIYRLILVSSLLQFSKWPVSFSDQTDARLTATILNRPNINMIDRIIYGLLFLWMWINQDLKTLLIDISRDWSLVFLINSRCELISQNMNLLHFPLILHFYTM